MVMYSWGILGPPYGGIGATIRIGREMLCLPYAGFLVAILKTPGDGFMLCVTFSCPEQLYKWNLRPCIH